MPAYTPALQRRHFCSVDCCSLLWLWDPEKEHLLGGLLVWFFFFSFLFFWLVWMPEYNLAHHQDILSWCWQVPSSVLLQDFRLGMRWENPTVSVSRWGCQVASARAAVDTVGDHQVGEESGSLFIAYLCNITIEINAVGFFLKLFLNSGNVILTMNFRTSENLGFRNLTIGVFKRQ